MEISSNKERYDKQSVTIEGILRLELEGDALYLDAKSLHGKVYKKSFYLLMSEELRKKYSMMKLDLNGTHVKVTGTFLAQEKGMWGLFAGTIQAKSIGSYPDKQKLTEEDIQRITNKKDG